MAWELKDKEFEVMLQALDKQRYEYFIHRVADCQLLWSLNSDSGWALSSDEQGRELIPIWPHERYASVCTNASWYGTKPEPISIDDWLEFWIPGMKADNRYAVVFPTPSNHGIVRSPDMLAKDIYAELEKYG